MDKKTYYRLNELQHHYAITADEIRYFVEQQKLQLSFLLPGSELMFGNLAKFGFRAFGFGYYKGLVSVNCEMSLRLFQKDKATTSQVQIRKGEYAAYSIDYPFAVSPPNSVMQVWQLTKLKEAPSGGLLAKKHPYEGASATAAMSEAVEMLKSFKRVNSDVKTLGQSS